MKKKYKKMELKKVPFTKLLKLEHPELADNVIRVVEKHNPEELLTQEVLDLLIAEKPQINLLTSRYGVNPMTAMISLGNDKLLLSVSAIKLHARIALKDNNPETLLHYPIFEAAMNRHLQKLRNSKNYKIIHRKVEQFLQEVKVKPELNTALSALGLQEYVGNLQMALISAVELLDDKNELVSQRSQESSSDIAAPVVFAIKNVFKEVEVLRVKNTDKDYTALFNELNQVIGTFRDSVSRREISNRKKAAEKKALESGGVIENLRVYVDNDGSDGSTEEMQTDIMTTPSVSMASTNGDVSPDVEKISMNGFKEGLDVDFDQSIDQKKTVASSSKNMQLPDLNDEA